MFVERKEINSRSMWVKLWDEWENWVFVNVHGPGNKGVENNFGENEQIVWRVLLHMKGEWFYGV